jgi:transcription termination/antitermination protein NusG
VPRPEPVPFIDPNFSFLSRKKDMAWYCCKTQSGYENHTVSDLRSWSFYLDLQDKFGETLIPVENSKKVFLGYLFIEMIMTLETFWLVKSLPKVQEFGSDDCCAPRSIPSCEIEKLIENMIFGSSQSVAQKKKFFEGQVFYVLLGPFAGFSGKVAHVDGNKITLNIMIFGRNTHSQFSIDQVSKDPP